MQRIKGKKTTRLILASLFVSTAVFFLYFSMLPSEYTDANYGVDGGDLLSAVLTDGIPHPSGYPTYLLLGKFFQALPFGTPYFKGALLSVVFSTLAAGLLTFVTGLVLKDENDSGEYIILSVTSGIALGVSPLFWSQAVINEVYGLTSFFIVCTILWTFLIMRGSIKGKKDLYISILSILIGLGFGNHLMIGLLIPVIIFASVIFLKNGNRLRILLKYFVLMLVAMIVVYAILPFRASKFPPINWGNPQTLRGFIWLVSGKLYQRLAFRIPVDEIFSRILFFSDMLRKQFGVLGMFIGILGLVKIASSTNRMKWAYIWVLTVFPVFSIGYLTNDSIVYLLPVFIVFALLIGYGLKELWEMIKGGNRIINILVCLVFLLPLFIRLPGIWAETDPRRDLSAKTYAEICLDLLPNGAILITEKDADTFPMWYYHFGLGRRPDIHVVVHPLLAYDWYRDTITRTYPDIQLPDVDVGDIPNEFAVINTDLPVCISTEKEVEVNNRKCTCP